MGKGQYTAEALIARNAERQYNLVMLGAAVDYARGHQLGARATLSTKQACIAAQAPLQLTMQPQVPLQLTM